MNAVLVLEQTKSNTVHRCVSPSLVKEAACPVQMVEVVLIRLTPPKVHIANLKITPKVTRRVPVRLVVVIRPPGLVHQPIVRAVLVLILRMVCKEFARFRPQGRDGLGRIVQVDCEAVGLVVVVHVAEDVVVNVAEKVYLGLDAPIVLGVCEGRVFVEETAVPAAHLVVGFLVGILDVLLFENLDRLLE